MPEDTRFDVIFAWDLLNYLQRKELAHFATHLRRYCNPGARLFALMSILKTMPTQPFRFKIQDEQTLVYERRTGDDRLRQGLGRPGPRGPGAALRPGRDDRHLQRIPRRPLVPAAAWDPGVPAGQGLRTVPDPALPGRGLHLPKLLP